VDRLVAELDRLVRGDGGIGRRTFSLGVSRVAAAPQRLPDAYEQARKAIRIGRRLSGTGARASFDRLGDERKSEPLMPQRARCEGPDHGRERRERPGRGVARAPQRFDFCCRERLDQRSHQLDLGRKIVIDRAGGDAGALCNGHDLHGRHAAFDREVARRDQYGVMPRGELAGNIVGPAVGH